MNSSLIEKEEEDEFTDRSSKEVQISEIKVF